MGRAKSKFESGERAAIGFMIVWTILLYGIAISIVWVGVHYGAAPRWLAMSITVLLVALAIVAFLVGLLKARQILRQRESENSDS